MSEFESRLELVNKLRCLGVLSETCDNLAKYPLECPIDTDDKVFYKPPSEDELCSNEGFSRALDIIHACSKHMHTGSRISAIHENYLIAALRIVRDHAHADSVKLSNSHSFSLRVELMLMATIHFAWDLSNRAQNDNLNYLRHFLELYNKRFTGLKKFVMAMMVDASAQRSRLFDRLRALKMQADRCHSFVTHVMQVIGYFEEGDQYNVPVVSYFLRDDHWITPSDCLPTVCFDSEWCWNHPFPDRLTVEPPPILQLRATLHACDE